MRETERRTLEAYRFQFGDEPQLVASAPGRVNLIGEHTDYNGGFVLPCAINRRVAVAAGWGDGGLYSADFEQLLPLGDRRCGAWVDYPSGVAWALRGAGHDVPAFRAAFAGDVPLGAGLSSSAAIEAATALALDALFDLDVPRRDLAVLCQTAENRFVGVNSGIMDQYASLLSEKGAALFVDCRSLAARPIPFDLGADGLALLVCDTRVERGLAETGYNERRASCERAAAALSVPQLRDASPADLGRLGGAELQRARHVVYENGRVVAASAALEQRDFLTFGRLMYASHSSLRDDYEVSTPELDAVVEVGRASGALGARLTGAGFGGCAIVLLDAAEQGTFERDCREEFSRRSFAEPAFYRVQPSVGAEVLQ